MSDNLAPRVKRAFTLVGLFLNISSASVASLAGVDGTFEIGTPEEEAWA
jgi:hypothetical protein